MIMESDDDGRLIADPAELRAKIFPFHRQVTVGEVRKGIRELARLKLIRLYQRGGIHYAHFTSWRDWQKPKYPSASRLPIPPAVAQDSPSIETPLRKRSRNVPPRIELNRIGSDRTESESSPREDAEPIDSQSFFGQISSRALRHADPLVKDAPQE
jgi:hypothetical protein